MLSTMENKIETQENSEYVKIEEFNELKTMFLELAEKYANLEKKIDEILPSISYKNLVKIKTKQDIIVLLNKKYEQCDINYTEWIKLPNAIIDDICDLIKIKNVFDVLKNIINRTAFQSSYERIPIIAVKENGKQVTLVIYVNEEEKWVRIDDTMIITYLRYMHKDIMKKCTDWRMINKEKLRESEELEIVYDDVYNKLLKVEFTQNSQTFIKFKSLISSAYLENL